MKTGLAIFLLLAAGLTWAAGLPDRATFSVTIERGDVVQARVWLEEGLPADFAGDVIGSGLMIGAWEGNIPMMDLFRGHGADVNQANAHGETALLLAAWKGRMDAVRWLLARGAQVNRPGKQWSALHYAAFAGHADIVSYLLTQGADANAPSPNGSTPLMMAAREGRAAIARQLLAAGARGAIVNDNGENAVLWAMRNNNPDIARSIVGSKDFAAIAERPGESWGRAVRSQQVPDQADQLLAQARKMEAAGRPDVALKYYRSALLAIRTAEKAAGKTATPRAVTGLVISAQRGDPAVQSAGLRYATPGAGMPVIDDASDPAEALLRRARELEASGRRGEALQAYRQAAALLRNAQKTP